MSEPGQGRPPPEEVDARDVVSPPRAQGGVAATGVLRAVPEDFRVDEVPPDTLPEEGGEHAWLHVRKRGANTEWVARALARHAGVEPVAVGYAGMKDRDAVTTQWFSVGLGGRPEPDWSALAEPGVEVLSASRRRRKLRRGELAGNRFVLRVTGIDGDAGLLAERLRCIAAGGVPNYFGAQRFGHDGGNVAEARAMLAGARRVKDRHRRGLYLSAARSMLFNRVLAARVADGSWATVLPGDVDARAPQPAPPTGPLWGRGRPPVSDATLAVETAALAALSGWCDALEHVGLSQERRSLRLAADAFEWCLDAAAAVLEIRFTLPAGAFATVVLREAVETGPGRAGAALD